MACRRFQRPAMVREPGRTTAPTIETGLLANSLMITETFALTTYLAVRTASSLSVTSVAVNPWTVSSPTRGSEIAPLSFTLLSTFISGTSSTFSSTRSFGPSLYSLLPAWPSAVPAQASRRIPVPRTNLLILIVPPITPQAYRVWAPAPTRNIPKFQFTPPEIVATLRPCPGRFDVYLSFFMFNVSVVEGDSTHPRIPPTVMTSSLRVTVVDPDVTATG